MTQDVPFFSKDLKLSVSALGRSLIAVDVLSRLIAHNLYFFIKKTPLSAVIEGDSGGPNKALTVLISFCLSCHLTRNVFVLSALEMESQPRYFLIIERSAGTQG